MTSNSALPLPAPRFEAARRILIKLQNAGQEVCTMRRSRDIELSVGRSLARAYPWLLKVQQPPDCGLIDFAAVWLYPPAANDPAIEPAQPDTPTH